MIISTYKLIVGLGNPGKKYRHTKHNIGFDVIDAIYSQLNSGRIESKFNSLISNQKIGEKDVILAKPMTFMNLSGKAVKEIIDYFEIPLNSICIVYDDLNLDLGVLRLRRSGSAGGHNGMKSIIEHLNSKDFPRLRIGIGIPPDNTDWMDYVLSDFPEPAREIVNQSIEKAVDTIKTFIIEGIDSAMNKYNS